MHDVSIPAGVLESIRALRGRAHVFDHIEPARTALLVVDMQNFFVEALTAARGIVPNINRIAAALREAGGLVVWIQATHSAEGRGAWTLFFEHFVGHGHGQTIRAQLMPGAHGHALFPGLDVRATDLLLPKDRFSAFVPGPDDLEARLRDRGIDSVLVTGTNTNVCCESTARDAMMRDFRTFVIEDANAAYSDEEHVAGLVGVARVFADVRRTDEVLGLIAAAAHERSKNSSSAPSGERTPNTVTSP
jgi:ureidoacrylate peracid hydrolase